MPSMAPWELYTTHKEENKKEGLATSYDPAEALFMEKKQTTFMENLILGNHLQVNTLSFLFLWTYYILTSVILKAVTDGEKHGDYFRAVGLVHGNQQGIV